MYFVFEMENIAQYQLKSENRMQKAFVVQILSLFEFGTDFGAFDDVIAKMMTPSKNFFRHFVFLMASNNRAKFHDHSSSGLGIMGRGPVRPPQG